VNCIIDRVLIPEADIQKKVAELARQISKDYEDRELLLISILKGAIVFTADLIRQLSVKVQLDFIFASSYGSATESSGVVRIQRDLTENIEGKHVLLVEDIVDTGFTLKKLVETLQNRNTASLKVCTLLDKPDRRLVDFTPDYCGFSIPDAFVVGYGLDFDENFRHLPYVAVIKKER
jgi:hypoxanthine phosphoribosyltransferase